MTSPVPMRIAYVINSMEGGGASAPVPAVIETLQSEGARVEVFALLRRDGLGLPALERAGVAVHVRDGQERDHLSTFRWLDQAMGTYRPDLIWTSLSRATLLGQLVGARRRVPVVSWQHAAYLKPANRLLLRANQRLSTLWVGDSESVTTLTARRLGVPSERLTCWPLFAANADAPQAAPWTPGQALRIGSLGRLHSVKGYDVLIEALARLRRLGFSPAVPFEVLIAGQGGQQAALQAAIDAAGLTNVTLVGYVDQPRAFLAGLHLYLQPSRSEGLCIAAHEAMQAGLPVIASAVGELPFSIAPDITGLVVPPQDPTALAAALAQSLAAPEKLASMGLAARHRLLDRFGAEAFRRNGARILTGLERKHAIGRAARA